MNPTVTIQHFSFMNLCNTVLNRLKDFCTTLGKSISLFFTGARLNWDSHVHLIISMTVGGGAIVIIIITIAITRKMKIEFN